MHLGWSGTSIDTAHDADEEVIGEGPMTVVHDQTIRMTELRIGAEVGVSEDVGIALLVPLRLVETEITYLDASGDEVDIADAGLHHRDDTLFGLADPWLLAHRHAARGRLTIDVRGGLSVPLGRTEEDPFAAGDAGIEHEHIQFGTGTFNPIVGVELGYGLPRFGVHLHALTQQVIYENDRDYLAGDRYTTGVSASSMLGTRAWRFEAGVDLLAETAELWNDVEHTDDGNRGRIDVLAGAAIAREIGGGVNASLGLKAPLYTHTVGGQLEYPLIVDLALSRSFELSGHEHEHEDEHEHEHEDEHDGVNATVLARDLDIVDLTDSGEPVDLDPVAGKVTVFDFWAPWCAPCRELDRSLRALAARHPDRLAIRRINVVDWDSAASARHLNPGRFNLPHLKVTRVDGTLAIEKSAPPAELMRDVEALLAE